MNSKNDSEEAGLPVHSGIPVAALVYGSGSRVRQTENESRTKAVEIRFPSTTCVAPLGDRSGTAMSKSATPPPPPPPATSQESVNDTPLNNPPAPRRRRTRRTTAVTLANHTRLSGRRRANGSL
ncbi:hypothetical protein EVAR_52162_1 [Eumeta japonica]|uniref:Uncharacterized protein n=1 Tax=Eumeta variegata TaxID=151549 RepID=A0A4C1YEC3_EUMVA|nr:hypothetical protein EVAR_52162_1 [Eumeta japonica]